MDLLLGSSEIGRVYIDVIRSGCQINLPSPLLLVLLLSFLS